MIQLSASNLAHFVGCRHRIALDMAVARGTRTAPTWVDPMVRALQLRGADHERTYAHALRAEGLTVVNLTDASADEAVVRTTDAMGMGAPVILQPALRNERWFGRPDVLRRVESPSKLGPWSYEVFDTKLAKETRGTTVLQLALYSELLGAAQGSAPACFHVVTPDAVHTYRTGEFAAYLRFIRSRLEEMATQEPEALAAANYPEPVELCDVCRWWPQCNERRRADDHLSLVAGISRLQRHELQSAGVTTLAQLGTMTLPFAPRRGAVESYTRVREQARLQLVGRTEGRPIYELLPVLPDQGLARLPAPSPGDVFLDLEGDPFADAGGREYLFGMVTIAADGTASPRAFWACSAREERAAFEAVVDTILQCWQAHPGMHVYHYAPYEPAAFKRLMGRHATRETEIDRMLRAELFVDLYAVVRHALRASVERYSIKDLEPFYGFTRSVGLADARTSLRVVEHALELGTTDAMSPEARAAVEGYNRDDCLSALRLREWLEKLRASLEASGTEVPRPSPKDGAAPPRVGERAKRVHAAFAALTADLSPERAERDHEQQARWLLAHLLDWHRREAKAPWWEFFRLRDLPEHELLAEKAALSGLRFVSRVGGTLKSPIDRYTYPVQDAELGTKDSLHLPDGTDFGEVVAIDRTARTVDVKKRVAQAEAHPAAVFAHSFVNTDVLADALLRIADDVLVHGISGGEHYGAARELLLNRAPRLRSGRFEAEAHESPLQFAVRAAPELHDTVLAIQGPPGAGKTYTAAHMICELVQRGSRVGITAVSHKVIRKLMDDVSTTAQRLGVNVSCLQKIPNDAQPTSSLEHNKNDEVLARLADRRANVVAATPWLWARPEAQASVDVLFVDEAGQMSLANVLAASTAAKSVVLVGDPQQLEQPQQGTHPEGSDASALEHVLAGHKTIPNHRGIFLPETWRLAPSICAFTSEVFYEGRLRARAGLEQQALVGTGPFEGAGLFVVPVAHEGNASSSSEEVEVIEQIIARLLQPDARWVDGEGATHAMTPEHALVVTPYNSQVARLTERLQPQGVRVGTVDKFQGQEAPVVIYSMATSTPEDAPRGMEFLYSLNRLNVATSRARCACIVVASPRLFEPECKSPRQMQLANAMCRYRELARVVHLD